jgi:hypothetical protein
MKVLDRVWFSPMGVGCIGIVAVEDEITGEKDALVGAVPGLSEEADVKWIMERGAKIPLVYLKGLVKILEPKPSRKGTGIKSWITRRKHMEAK